MARQQQRFTQRFKPYSGTAFLWDVRDKKNFITQRRIVGTLQVREVTMAAYWEPELNGWAIFEVTTGARLHSVYNCTLLGTIEQTEKVFEERGYNQVRNRIIEVRGFHKLNLEEINKDMSTLALQMLGYE